MICYLKQEDKIKFNRIYFDDKETINKIIESYREINKIRR